MRKKPPTCFINRGSDGEDQPFSTCTRLDDVDSYIGQDPVGVELAGALKNVYAIAAGIADGLGFQNNTRASNEHH
jgi:glycerol-3-phosphate dehydrogenase